MSVKYVRLKPYNPRGGYKVKRIDWRDPVSGKWFVFTRAGVWHKTDAAVADRMALTHQDPYDEDTPLVFDVENETGARALDSAAKAEREAARVIVEPTVDTAIDLTEKTPKATRRAAALDTVTETATLPEPDESIEPERPKRSVRPKQKPKARTRKRK